MKAYFTASIAGKDHLIKNYNRIVDHLVKLNVEVIADHILNLTESQVNLQTKEQRLNFHDKLEKWITSSDFAVVEASFPSISVGYEIALALHSGKHVLVLYTQEYPPALMAFHKDEKLVCEKYTMNTVTDIIDDFISYVSATHDQRFTFFITSEIALYLEKIARREKLPKSVYLRKLIEKDMRENN